MTFLRILRIVGGHEQNKMNDYERRLQEIEKLLSGKITRAEENELLHIRNNLVTEIATQEEERFNKEHRSSRSVKKRLSQAGRHKKLTQSEIASIRAEYRSGRTSMRALASRYHLSLSTVHEYLADIPREKDYRYKIPQRDVFTVANMYRSDMTMETIASKFDVSESTVSRTIRQRAGVNTKYPRKRSERRKRQERAKLQPQMNQHREPGYRR